MMDPEKRKALEAAGFRFGDAADFLELTEEESAQVAVRVSGDADTRTSWPSKPGPAKDWASGSAPDDVVPLEDFAEDMD